MSDSLMIPPFLDRRAAPGHVCAQCSDAAEFGHRVQGEMQWYCDKHKISQNYADERLPKVSACQQALDALTDELAGRAEHIRGIWKRAAMDRIRIRSDAYELTASTTAKSSTSHPTAASKSTCCTPMASPPTVGRRGCHTITCAKSPSKMTAQQERSKGQPPVQCEHNDARS